MKKETILVRFKIAVDNFEKAQTIGKVGVLEKRNEFSRTAGDAIYEVIEWSMKRHIIKRLDILLQTGRISREEYYKEKNNVDKKFDIYKLKDKMSNVAEPKISNTTIDWELILAQKYRVRNSPVHSAKEVDLQALAAIIPEVKKIVDTYVDSNFSVDTYEKKDQDSSFESNWDDLFAACNQFDPTKSVYVLLTGKMETIDLGYLGELGKIPWTLIIDFDATTTKGGFFDAYKQVLGKSPHYITVHQLRDLSFSKISKTPYWFFANGDSDVPDTLPKDQADWRRNYTNPINQLIEKFSRVYDRNVKLVVAHEMRQHVQTVCNFFDVHCQDRLEIIMLPEKKEAHQEIFDTYVARHIPITIHDFVNGILSYKSYFDGAIQSSKSNIMIPGKNGSVEIQQNDYDALQEDFDIVHLNKHYTDEDDLLNVHNPIDFYKGRQITWQGLSSHFDIKRRRTKGIEDTIIQLLKNGANRIVTLSHSPGVGGSTTSRRIAWNLHEVHPTVILKQYREKLTAANLVKLYRMTTKTALVIAETGQIGIDNLRKLLNEVWQTTTPIVILAVTRSTFRDNDFETNKALNHLNDRECEELIAKITPYLYDYNEKVREKKIKELQEVRVGDMMKRTPFYIGLIAFEEEFVGLEDYVRGFLNDLGTVQRKVVLYLSMVHYYANKGLPEHYFSQLLRGHEDETSARNPLQLEDYLPNDLHLDSLLIREVDADSRMVYWRPRHHLLSREIMIQLVSGHHRHDVQWLQNLGDYAIDLIRDVKIPSGVASDEIILILRDLFITRDNNEITNERFSKMIRDILDGGAGTETTELIFNELVTQYPGEAHFWGHLARYYSNIVQNTPKALECADKAISLSPKKDPLLYHIKGICYKREVTSIIDKIKAIYRGENPDHEEKQVLMSLLKIRVADAAEQFSLTRDLNNEMHGYISHIQMLTDVIDMGRSISGCSLYAEFFQSTSDDWYKDCLDIANNLYDDLEKLDIDPETSFLTDAEKRIKRLYDNYGHILQMWNNLLEYGKSNKEMIRRHIVRTSVHQAGSYGAIHPDKLRRLASLMEENIRNEPKEAINIELWFKIARHLEEETIDSALHKMKKWIVNANSITAIYYYYILKVLKGIEGNSLAIAEANDLITLCSQKSFSNSNRTKIFEWLGEGNGLSKLINYKSFSRQTQEDERKFLPKIEGKFIEWEHAGSGVIDHNGLKVFFRPSQGNNGKSITKADEGKKVYFSLGFSYDKLRAYDFTVITEEYMKSVSEEESTLEEISPRRISRKKIYPDDIVQCVVIRINSSFAIVKVEGVDEPCNIHISQLSNGYVKSVGDVLKVGARLDAKVLKYDERHGYQLSLRIDKDFDKLKYGIKEEPSALAEQLEKWKRGNN